MTESIKKTFHIEEVATFELGEVLLKLFNYSTGTDKGYRYQRQGESDYVEIEYDKKFENITNIVLSKNFPTSRLQEIEQTIKDILVDNQSTKYLQDVCFTVGSVTGSFRYKDYFQIVPLPDNAPKPPDAVSHQPFYLQFAYIASSDGMINAERQDRQLTKWVRLLNIFLNRPIEPPDKSGEKTWVMMPTDNHTSQCLQNGYYFEGLYRDLAGFTVYPTQIMAISPQDYYSVRGIDSNPLQVPSNLEQLLDKALALSPEHQKLFSQWSDLRDEGLRRGYYSFFVPREHEPWKEMIGSGQSPI